jgi:hypothetical protein
MSMSTINKSLGPDTSSVICGYLNYKDLCNVISVNRKLHDNTQLADRKHRLYKTRENLCLHCHHCNNDDWDMSIVRDPSDGSCDWGGFICRLCGKPKYYPHRIYCYICGEITVANSDGGDECERCVYYRSQDEY